MSGSDLADFQADFAAALAAGDPAARPAALDAGAAARFRVYRNNLYHGLSEQLAEAYPVVRRLVGEAFFDASARAFLAEHLPRQRSLALFGAGFPDFLAGFPPAASLPYLADVARLERARLEALHAADAAPLAPAELSRLGAGPAEGAFALRFVAHPAARLVASDHPVATIWCANRPEVETGAQTIAATPETALITRPRLRVELAVLSPAQAAFAGRLLLGDDLASAIAAASGAERAFDVTGAFRQLLTAGAFVRVRP